MCYLADWSFIRKMGNNFMKNFAYLVSFNFSQQAGDTIVNGGQKRAM